MNTPTYEELLKITIKQRDEAVLQCDEWRNVADLLAAELDELTHDLGDSDAMLKFKELEKKYPL